MKNADASSERLERWNTPDYCGEKNQSFTIAASSQSDTD